MKVLAQESGRVVPVSRRVSGVRVEGMLQNNQALPRRSKHDPQLVYINDATPLSCASSRVVALKSGILREKAP